MRPSRLFVATAALALATAMSALPTQADSAQPPSTQVGVPSYGATVSGIQVVLDASASAGVTKVQFELSQGTVNYGVVATATPTIYGWIALFDSLPVANGTYTLKSVATSGGSSGTSPGISITVSNGPPTMSWVLPPNGGTVSGTQVVFDAVGPAGVTGVQFAYSAPGCPSIGLPPPEPQQYICTLNATPTIYGWIALWNSTTVPNGGYAVSVYCGQCGINNPPTTSITVDNPAATVVAPANGSSLTYDTVLDCVPPAGYVGVSFWIEGPGLSQPQDLGNATPTDYGWLKEWGDPGVASGPYSLYCTAAGPSGANAFSPTILVYV